MSRFFISNEAYRFYNTHASKHKISEFIKRLSEQEFIDTRPEEFKLADEPRLEANLLPFWYHRYPRYSRCLRLTIYTINNLVNIAVKFNLNKELKNPTTLNYTTNALVSLTLEVIGQQMLTPVQMPDKPKRIYQFERRLVTPVRYTEFEW